MENKRISYDNKEYEKACMARKQDCNIYVMLNNGQSFYTTGDYIAKRVNAEVGTQLALQKQGYVSAYLPCGIAKIENFVALCGKVEYSLCSMSDFIDYKEVVKAMELCEMYNDVAERLEMM